MYIIVRSDPMDRTFRLVKLSLKDLFIGFSVEHLLYKS
jgi:hypothetical protein